VLCVCKVTLLVFFYEVFPKRFRKVLHAASAIVVCTFVANILETVFWCYPLRRMWAHTESLSNDYCALKLNPGQTQHPSSRVRDDGYDDDGIPGC